MKGLEMNQFNRSIIKTIVSLLIAFLFVAAAPVSADVKLPHVIGSNMVLQRDKPILIWGWAEPGEEIKVEFAGQKAGTKADEKGNWMVRLPAMGAGGPLKMTVNGRRCSYCNESR